jgi:protein-disulfide isomerase
MRGGARGDEVVPVMAEEHIKGAPDAPLVLEEFGDFECTYCKQTFPILRSLLSGREAFIRLVYRHFPATEAHPHAELAAEAAEAAATQGRFWEFHDLVFSRTGELDAKLLIGFAQRLGLDLPRFHGDLDMHVHRARVLRDLEAGRSRGLRGTPGFYLDGKFIDTSYGLHHLRDAVRDGLARINGLPPR